MAHREEDNAFVEERRKKILDLLREKKRVTVKELSEHFGISEVTIRQDLNELASGGRIVRTHGGAVFVGRNGNELSFFLRKEKQKREKEIIASLAARYVCDGEVIFLDSSTTAAYMIPFLKDKHEITIVTNGMEVAYQAINQLNVTVMLTGGRVRRNTFSLVGVSISCILPEGNISKAFLGSWGVSLKEGFTDVNSAEIEIKKAAMERAQSNIILADSSKWGRVSFRSFAYFTDVDLLITDSKAPPEMIEKIGELGLEIVVPKK